MWLALAAVCAAVLSLAAAYLYLDPQIPDAATYRQVRLETPLRVYTAERKLIAEFGERRLIPITLDQVPPLFVRAVLDTEDKRFYEHSGVDLISLVRAAVELVLNRGEITQGASTITMQLPRNLGTFSLDQLFIRKFKEILLALKIEQELTKDEILELYINAVPFGKRAYGAQAAAFTYYGKPLDQLTLAQLAMLAGIPQAPTAGNPINGPRRALTRRNVVLARMLDQGSITRAQYDAAVASPVTARLHERDLDVPAPYPAEWVRQQLLARLPDLYTGGYEVVTTLDAERQRAAAAALRRGLIAYDRRHGYRGPERRVEAGSVDEALAALEQTRDFAGLRAAVVTEVGDEQAEAVLRDGSPIVLTMESLAWARPFQSVDSRGPAPARPADVLAVGDLIRVRAETVPAPEAAAEDPAAAAEPGLRWMLTQVPAIQGALVSLDPDTGAVQAMVGGFDFAINQFNHALQAARQPGSGFKPFVYAAALAHGVTPASIYMDAPLVFEDKNLESQYRPDNDNNRYNGPTRLREALYRSINLVTMRVLLDVGANRVLDYSKRFGFDTSDFPRNTQLAVGGGTMAVSPMEMAVAYAVFANGGHLIEPHVIDEIYDVSGARIFKARHPVVCRDCDGDLAIDLSELPYTRRGDARQSDARHDDESGREPPAPAEAPGPGARPVAAEVVAAAPADPVRRPAHRPRSVVIHQGEPVIAAQRVLDERIAFIMHTMLQDVIRRGTGVRARQLERGDLAGKTGTTNDAADTWFNGYNPELVTTVWVGFPNHAPLGAREYGSNTPLPIWMDYMKVALADRPERHPPQPGGVVTMKIDPATGERTSPGNPDAVFEYFLAEHTPAPAARHTLDHPRDEEEQIKPVEIF